MPLKEAALIPVNSVADACDIDEVRDFQIVSAENEDGQLTVSIRRLEYQGAWDAVLEVRRTLPLAKLIPLAGVWLVALLVAASFAPREFAELVSLCRRRRRMTCLRAPFWL
jgi:hypothetical protein